MAELYVVNGQRGRSCSKCGKWKPWSEFHKDASKVTLHMSSCKDCGKAQDVAYWRSVKRATMDAYGGACACCGEAELMFLTIDHVNQNGAEHRRQLETSKGGHQFYLWLRRQGYPPDFRVLCFNCNIGRHFNGGPCPHLKEAA